MKFWYRFLDVCFVTWTQSPNDLNRLHYILNFLHPSINFTIEYSQKELPFLDVLVKKTGTSVDTDIYFKPRGSQQYLIFDSCHPNYIKLNIPYSLALRLKMIISSEETSVTENVRTKTHLTKTKISRKYY